MCPNGLPINVVYKICNNLNIRIMTYRNEFRIIEGNKETFEKKCNEASDEGFMWCGDLSATITEKGLLYSMFWSKSIPIE